MSTGSKLAITVLAVLTLAGMPVLADEHLSSPWLSVQFPQDSPVGVVSFSLGDSTAAVKGISLALGVHTSLTLRNTGSKRIRGLTLRVEAPDLTPSARASVTVPTLNAPPGEVFPVRLDLELLRPFNTVRNAGALVQITLDCVLFDDLSAYGPDVLHTRRSLSVYAQEAQRDREYFLSLIESGQMTRLQEEMNFGLPYLRPPQLGLELLSVLARPDRVSRPVSVSYVPFPSSPVMMLNGAARVYRNELHGPEVHLKNTSQKAVEAIEVGWILRDDGGRDYMAGMMPARVSIGPVQNARYQQNGVLRFSYASGRPVIVSGIRAFIDNVQFSDGTIWIPSRTDISNADLDPALKRVIESSPEQQRLVEIYRRHGLSGVTAELKKNQ